MYPVSIKSFCFSIHFSQYLQTTHCKQTTAPIMSYSKLQLSFFSHFLTVVSLHLWSFEAIIKLFRSKMNIERWIYIYYDLYFLSSMKLTFRGRSNLDLIYRIKNVICNPMWVWGKKRRKWTQSEVTINLHGAKITINIRIS